MRGAPTSDILYSARTGIIPAYAGSTLLKSLRAALVRDHPRICGEHTDSDNGSRWPQGSSPHMRGALYEAMSQKLNQRIIPAYAGSTRPNVYFGSLSEDHPRICGEHPWHRKNLQLGPGSSPHMRGALDLDTAWNYKSRIIPAYAGSTAPLYD